MTAWPLDASGAQQAEALARFLREFGLGRIVSADVVRCVQSVAPLSRTTGVVVEEEPLLSELGYPGHEHETVELVRGFAEQGGAVVACSQGDVISDLLHRLASRDRVPLGDELVACKGSVWALCFSGRQLCGLEYLDWPGPAD